MHKYRVASVFVREDSVWTAELLVQNLDRFNCADVAYVYGKMGQLAIFLWLVFRGK